MAWRIAWRIIWFGCLITAALEAILFIILKYTNTVIFSCFFSVLANSCLLRRS